MGFWLSVVRDIFVYDTQNGGPSKENHEEIKSILWAVASSTCTYHGCYYDLVSRYLWRGTGH